MLFWDPGTSYWCGHCFYLCIHHHEDATTLGFCHTVVLDKDNKFFSICRESLDLLKINCHILLGNNHNPMLVEWLCWYFNKGLRIMNNTCSLACLALEAMLLLLYAWNSCPVPGTDISHSLVGIGRKFAFPIDFSTGMHWELTCSPTTVESYSCNLSKRLAICCKIAMLLVSEHHAWHRELINSRWRNPRVYTPITLSLLAALFGLMPWKVVRASSNFLLLVPGRL